MADSNVNLASYGIYGNTGTVLQNVEPGIAKGIIAVPRGLVIPVTSFDSPAAFYTYLTASTQGTIADGRSTRWFPFLNLDTFEDKTKAMGTTDTGLDQFETIKFNTKYSFRVVPKAGNKANHTELLAFDNSQNQYDHLILDSFGNIWGTADPAGSGGMKGYSVAQMRVMDWKPATTKDGLNEYEISCQYANRAQFNENFAIYAAGLDNSSIPALTNSVFTDVSATLGTPLAITTTTDVVLIWKSGGGSVDMAQYYLSSLTNANKMLIVATDLTAGGTLALAATGLKSGSLVVAGQLYFYLWIILASAPTGHLVQYTLAAPSVANALIPNLNSVTEIIPGTTGNGAQHQF